MLKYLFGESAIVKILDFLLDEWEVDFSKTDVARSAKLTWKAVDDAWSILEKFELVKHTRTVGRAKMYKINVENPIYKALKALDMEILKKLDERC